MCWHGQKRTCSPFYQGLPVLYKGRETRHGDKPLQLSVFFLPTSILPAPEQAGDVYIVIDLIRATTSIAVMLDQGVRRIFVAGSIEQARAARALYPQRLLCGERQVRPLPGFDYGNSPVQFATARLRDHEPIMTTTNGTRAFHACPSGAFRLAGSLYNGAAVVEQALDLAAAHQVAIHLVCAGEEDAFGLDDAVCAGYLVLEMQRQANRCAHSLDLHESALAAQALYEAYPPSKLLTYSNAARQVIAGGLPADPPFCLRTDVSRNVGMVVGQEAETGLLIIEGVQHISQG
jgi:2-phosphosulfolactate phosphatase